MATRARELPAVPPLTLGLRLRLARTRQLMSVDDAAGRVGLTKSTLARYERDEVEPPLRSLRALAGLYGVEVAALLESDRFTLESYGRQGTVARLPAVSALRPIARVDGAAR